VIGSRVKIQTGAQIYHGAVLEDGVFVGPLVCITNDKHPRAINPDGRLKSDSDWVLGRTHVCYGASLGAGSIVLPDVTIGRFAMVAAGAVVTQSVPDFGLVAGSPARLVGYVCACGRRLHEKGTSREKYWECAACTLDYLKISDDSLCPRPGLQRPILAAAESLAR
jgi:acetyltransferase-like isoleucine patch superfamily enzyme